MLIDPPNRLPLLLSLLMRAKVFGCSPSQYVQDIISTQHDFQNEYNGLELGDGEELHGEVEYPP
jgi:hypothetical protein